MFSLQKLFAITKLNNKLIEDKKLLWNMYYLSRIIHIRSMVPNSETRWKFWVIMKYKFINYVITCNKIAL